MEAAANRSLTKPLMCLVIACGLAAVFFSIYRISTFQDNAAPYLLLSLIASVFALRKETFAAWAKSDLPVTEFFIFLAMLLFGGEAAVLLSAALVSCTLLSRRTGNTLSLLFNASITVIATFLIVWLLRFSYGSIIALQGGRHLLNLINAICLSALIQSAGSSIAFAREKVSDASSSVWLIWGRNYLWMALKSFACAVIAGLAARLVGLVGYNAFISVATVVTIVNVAWPARSENSQTLKPHTRSRKGEREERSERFRQAFDYAAIGMALVSVEGHWLHVNYSLCELLGYSEEELLATDFMAMTHPDDLGLALANINHLLKGKTSTYQMEKRYFHKLGHEVWVLWNLSLARDMGSQSPHLIFQLQDITDRKRAEVTLLHDAFHDALTGLPNRALFMDHLQMAVARAQRRPDQKFAVLYLDLDRFKIINDSLGHMIGDQLLVGIARRLESCLRPGDTVARLGGDEFTVLIEGIKDEAEAIEVAERIQKELRVPFNLSGREVFTTVSIGIAPSSPRYDHPENILRDADTAMYRAKTLGKARHEMFDEAMHTFAMNLLQLETDLRRATERQEFFIQYQPIVALDDFRLRGFEALVRWRHPERGLVSPIDFIPVAEETSAIVQIGDWVLREACRQMHEWQEKFPSDPPLFISVNLSGKQFTQPDLITEISHILRETGVHPHSLKLEITESVVMDNIETATAMLQQLRALGVQLSIDDFGTGYSSLSYLHRFPINTLKIDRSFVTNMGEQNENTEIVRTIVMLAQNLGMDVVVEGVETNEQLALLRKLECENGQGYFFSRPVDVVGAEKIIADTYSCQVTAPKLVNSPRPFLKVLVTQ